MVSAGQVNSDASEITSQLSNYASIINELGSSWTGTSYNSLSTQASSFYSECSSALTSQMSSFGEAVGYYESYVTAKNNLKEIERCYNDAVSKNDSASISRYAADRDTCKAQMNDYKAKIEQCLSSVSSIVLEYADSTKASGGTVLTTSSDGTIEYKKARYKNTTVWYAVVPKGKMPQLAVANDNYNYLTNEAPSSMAKRNNAKLAINFGLTGNPAGMIYTNGRLVSDTGNPYDETLYMTQDGTLNAVRNSEYSTQDIINMNPVWASKGFYTIARDGQYVDENRVDPSLSVDRHPRTFIGQDYDGNYIVGVCDGRGTNEAGLTLREVYDFVNTEVTDNLRFLFNGDGGGSSAFIYDGEKLNSNTDGSERERPDLVYWA